MNYYYDLQRIDIGEAINKMAEVVLPCSTPNKILSVNITFDIGDYRRKDVSAPVCYKEYTFIYYRPDDNMFAGFMIGSHLNISSRIEELAYDKKNWRDEVSKKISEIASHISKRYEEVEGLTVYTSFGIFGAHIIHGNINTKTAGRKIKFIPIN